MTSPTPNVWLLRTVRSDGAPAPGVPVTVLDEGGNPAGYWVSDAEGLVALPRREGATIRLRVGLRSEEPLELTADALAREVVELPAPRALVPAVTTGRERTPAARPVVTAPVERPSELPGQVLHFQRVALLPTPPGGVFQNLLPSGEPGQAMSPVDFLDVADAFHGGLRYAALVEVEQYWQPLGPVAGELLYSVALPPGDEARISVADGRWPDQRSRPLEVLARMIAAPGQVDALPSSDAAFPLEPLTLVPSMGPEGGLGAAALETIRALNERTVRMSQLLRRRPLRVVEGGGSDGTTATRVVRNPVREGEPGRTVTYHFYEPLERYRLSTRAARLRPALLVPFRPPPLATRAMVRQHGHILRRALLDASLAPELERVLSLDATEARGAPPVSELRLIVERSPRAATEEPDLRQVWCFLHVDAARYTVHFFPTDAKAGVDAPTQTPHWIGAVRLADFHQRPLQYPGALSIQNGSASMLAFQAVHVEGRIAESWVRLHTVNGLVLPPQSQVRLASLEALAAAPGVDAREGRLLAHIAANIPHYAAAIIAAGDPGVRHIALSKVRDPMGFALADVVENTVVTVVGNYLAFPLRSPEFAPPGLKAALTQYAARPPRSPEETVVTLPGPGVWLSAQGLAEAAEVKAEPSEDLTIGRVRRGGR